MTRTPLPTRLLRRWHKRLGVLAAVFFTFLAVTGLALNHGDALGMDGTQVRAAWLMAWYGLKPTVPEQAFVQEGMVFCWQGDTWVLAGKRLNAGHGEPVGAVRIGEQIWIATAEEIRLYDREGRLVDKVERDLLPATPIRRIGIRNGQLVATAGPAIYASADGIAWERQASDATVNWVRLSPLPPALQQELSPLFAPSLPLQRIVADVHSGRIFGRYGVFFTDILAGILILLAGSGLWMHVGSRTKKAKQAKPPMPAAMVHTQGNSESSPG